ncbi:DNA-binding protein [bacterium D16-51]|nr:DNA-binding protein [bacterium D16-59]RKI51553.1 DNA-binding protein [bacterium D16-51]
MNNEPTELITFEELCNILSVGRNTAYKLLKENKIKAFRIGRTWKIPKIAVDDFILTQSHLNLPH